MLAALGARKEELESRLREKTEELKRICFHEAVRCSNLYVEALNTVVGQCEIRCRISIIVINYIKRCFRLMLRSYFVHNVL